MNVAKRSLPLSGVRLSTSCPLRLVGGGLPQMPLEPAGGSRGAWLCVNSPHDLESEGAFDINAFKRGSGGQPQQKNLKFFSFSIIKLS